MKNSSDETERVAEFIAELTINDIPEEVRRRSKLLILDTIGCIHGGYGTDVGRIIDRLLPETTGDEATIIGKRQRTRTSDAIFANARLANVLDADETLFSIEHLANAAVTVPLAICEANGFSGERLLAATVAGYEVGARIGPRPQLQVSEDGSPTWAAGRDGKSVRGFGLGMTYAATASAAKALSLPPSEVKHAFGIAGERVPDRTHSRIYDEFNPLIKYQQAGACARAGYEAALAASAGDTGVPTMLDGDDGIWAAFSVESVDHTALRRRWVSNLNERWETAELALKPWPCCHFNQFVLDDLSRLVEKENIEAPDVVEVTQSSPTYLTSPRFTDQEPDDMMAAEFSVPHAIAMVIRETPIDQWYAPEILDDPDVRSLRNRISVVPDESKSVRIEDGIIREIEFGLDVVTDEATHSIRSSMTKGMPWYTEAEMSEAAVREKFRVLTRSLYPQSQRWYECTSEVSDAVMGIEDHNVRQIMTRYGTA
ncbi:MmgE/PrpD family protein [Halobellus sp. GM3]|uniref:MmgE/PrpD family protein n=1 Tax=Halobellus sp. GM3 TaxID=3458410 RepID=UPI00403D7517